MKNYFSKPLMIFFLQFSCAVLQTQSLFAINYKWNGSSSSAWNNNLNWTPNAGFPLAGDNVTIVSGVPNQPQVDANRSIANFIMSSGTLDLNTFTLTITGTTVTCTAGTITNGTFSVSSAGTTTFSSGFIFASTASVNVVSANIFLNGSTFNGAVTIEKSGGTNNQCAGGNIFNGITTIKNIASAPLYLAYTNRDIFNSDVTFTNTNSSYIYVAHNDTTGTRFNGNVIVNATSTGSIFFGQGTSTGKSILANGKTISIGLLGFKAVLRLKNFKQIGSTPQTLTSALSGASLQLQAGTVFNGDINFVFPHLSTIQSTFNANATIEKTGTTNSSSGGNIFNGTTYIKNSGSGSFTLGNSTYGGDDFNGNVTFEQATANTLFPAYSATSYFSGNITTAGTAAIVLATFAGGRVAYDGSNTQTISGNASFQPNFNRITLSKTGGNVVLNLPIIVAADLTFSSGNIISPSGNLLTLGDNITMTGVSDNSHIEGPVKKIGNDAFTFPIGKNGKYRPIFISAPALSTDAFLAEYFMSSPHPAYDSASKVSTITHVSDAEYWILNRTFGTSAVSVTLSWNNSTSGGVTLLSDLRVARWDGTKWQDHGNGGTTGDTTNGTVITSSAVASFSPFTLASSSTANPLNSLPVELVSFTAQCKGKTVVVNWATASETNNDYFQIERSADGKKFEPIGIVSGAGNSSAEHSYEFIDAFLFPDATEHIYYRLKQVDYDGNYNYYGPVAVRINQIGISIYPTITSGPVLISGLEGKTEISAYSLAGQKVYASEFFSTDTGQELLNLDLPNGIYFLQIKSFSFIQTKKLEVIR